MSLKSGSKIRDINAMVSCMNKFNAPTNPPLLQQLGERLRLLRKQRGISQEDFAALVGFSRSYYTEIETGKRNISLLNLQRIANALNMSLAELVQWQPASTTSPRALEPHGFIHPPASDATYITPSLLTAGVHHAYAVLDTMDTALVSQNAERLAEIVELNNLASILGNLLSTGLAQASDGMFIKNSPHKYPDLLAQTLTAVDIEIKTALEKNRPKGHLAKAGYYLIFRYVLCDANGVYQVGQRGNRIYVWEIRFGQLDESHFSVSNTPGDSGKTAVLNPAGMNALKIVYCDLSRCPYTPNSRTYKELQRLFPES